MIIEEEKIKCLWNGRLFMKLIKVKSIEEMGQAALKEVLAVVKKSNSCFRISNRK